MLCLAARYEGVRVPAEQASNPALRLILNRNFRYPIDVTSKGIGACLSFRGRHFACYIPLGALWAAFDPQTMQGNMWPDSTPPEVTTDMARQRSYSKPNDEALNERLHRVERPKHPNNKAIDTSGIHAKSLPVADPLIEAPFIRTWTWYTVFPSAFIRVRMVAI